MRRFNRFNVFARLLIAIILCTVLGSVPVAALEEYYQNTTTGYEAVIDDNAALFSPDEEAALLQKMLPCTEYGNILLVTIDENPYYGESRTERYAKEYYEKLYGSEISSGTVFMIDMDFRMLYILNTGSKKGDNRYTITSATSNIITDNAYKYASRGDYFGCANLVFDQINQTLNGEKVSSPMKVISNIILALIIAFILNFILVQILQRTKKVSDEKLVSASVNELNTGRPEVVKLGESKRYSPVSHSSGGGGGHGGGGGGHSGGGGGHSGGGHHF